MNSSSVYINIRKPLSTRDVQKIGFQQLPLSEKIKIRELGPPRPNFMVHHVKETEGSNKSNKVSNGKQANKVVYATKVYKDYDWLCGDEHKRLFFCFPCMLMGGQRVKGVSNPCQGYGRHHAKSESHVKNALNFAMLGKNAVVVNGNPPQNGYHQLHNEAVRRNRQLLLSIVKGFIEYADIYSYFLKGQETHNGEETSSVIEFLCRIDNPLKECYGYSPIFSTIKPKDLEEQILIAALQLYQSILIDEVNSAKFIALVTEETTDISGKDQMVIILRYLLDNRVVERFWGFVRPTERNPPSIAKSILDELHTILPLQKDKLISQSHIAGAVFSPLITDVHKLISEEYKNAIYVHYHAYKLNIVMERAVCQNNRARHFFAQLYGMYEFFEKNSKVLQQFFDCTPLYADKSFEKGALVFIYENKAEILNFMVMLRMDTNCPQRFIRETAAYEKLLGNPTFMYFLTFFYYLMADVNVFYESLQNSFVDSAKIAEAIHEFLDEIRKTKDAIAVENSDNDDKASEAFQNAFTKIEVCDIILKEIQERFRFTNHWEAHILLKSEQYYKFHGNFPDNILRNVIEYFQFKDPDKFRVELQVLYSRADLMTCRNAHELLYAFHHHRLKSVFEKTTALLHVILTIPTMLADAERKICAVKRVRRAAELAIDARAPTALTMLICEQESLKSFRNFAERLIDVYVKQERRENEFTFC